MDTNDISGMLTTDLMLMFESELELLKLEGDTEEEKFLSFCNRYLIFASDGTIHGLNSAQIQKDFLSTGSILSSNRDFLLHIQRRYLKIQDQQRAAVAEDLLSL
jgi:hypothetical protein